ncbi:MAG: hypothetical protein Kow0025_04470 [Thermodesulfovibrionales bacterium]
MKIKKYRAGTFREVLSLIKKELGEDAVILSSRELGGSEPSVEVTAAVDYDLVAGPQGPTQAARKAGRRSVNLRAGGPEDGAEAAPGAKRLEDLAREMEALRQAINDMRHKGYEVALPPGKKEVYRYLTDRLFREDLAMALAEKADGVADLPRLISGDVKASPPGSGKRAIALVGPTGVGKTTTLAKLAAAAVRRGRRVAMVNLDTYRIGAIEQIRIYSRILGVPLDVASGPEGLRKSLEKYADRDVVFIDTTGRNPRDGQHLDELKVLYGAGHQVETHLLLSANSDEAFLAESFRYYGTLPVDRLAFTKVDEAVRYGAIYSTLTLYRRPVAYLTTGQRVPEDIRFPDSAALTDLILSGGHMNEAARTHEHTLAGCGVSR